MRKIVFCALLVLTLAALAACGTKVPCYSCIGTGDCILCKGEGELGEDPCEECGGVNNGTYYDDNGEERYGDKKGSGECRYCSGSGVLEA